MFARLIGAIAVLCLSGCATTSTFQGLPGEGQHVEYQRGISFVTSPGVASTVEATARSEDGRVKIFLVIRNTGDRLIEYADSNVAAYDNGARMALVSASQQRQEAERSATLKNIVAGIAGGLNSYSAGRYGGTTSTHGTATVYDTYGRSADITYQTTSYDAAKAQEARDNAAAKTADLFALARADHDADMAAIDKVLQQTTIRPGEQTSGWITLNPSQRHAKQSEIELRILLGRDLHVIAFNQITQ